MMIMHTYTFRDYPIERALRKAKQYHFDAVELSPCHWGWSQDEMLRHLDDTMALAQRIGVPIKCLDFSGNFVGEDPAERKEAVARLTRLLPRMRSLGVPMVNGGCGNVIAGGNADAWNENGSAAATDQHWQRAAEAMRQVAAVAEQTGVLVTLEIHMNALHDTAASTMKLLGAIGSHHVKAALDAGNMLPLGRAESPAQAAKLLGGDLGYVHLKNCRMLPGEIADYNVSLDGGQLDLYKLVLALREIGYKGDFCIEYCGQGDASPKAEGDIAYFRSLLAEAGL
jgi:sugar phosphate isomerase/epimerase